MSHTITLNKPDLVLQLHTKHTSIPKQMISDSLETILDEIAHALIAGDRIEIRGFGTFGTRKRKQHAQNPEEHIEESSSNFSHNVYFRASRDIISLLNNKLKTIQ